MAPRVFLDVEGMPVGADDGKSGVIPLMNLNGRAAQLATSSDNGHGGMDIVEVEDLLRDISEQSAKGLDGNSGRVFTDLPVSMPCGRRGFLG